MGRRTLRVTPEALCYLFTGGSTWEVQRNPLPAHAMVEWVGIDKDDEGRPTMLHFGLSSDEWPDGDPNGPAEELPAPVLRRVG